MNTPLAPRWPPEEPRAPPPVHAGSTVTVLGLAQILAWGATYYLPAVLAQPIAQDTGWPLAWIVGALSLGTLTSGFAAPHVGRLIDQHGGRPVLAASALAFAAGLCGLALSPNLATYIACWILLGLGMAAGLYDAAFGTLGKLFGQDARRHITVLTLFGGFASTVCWPLSAWLVATLGWRGACASYAALHLLVVAPAYLLLLPRSAPAALSSAAQPSTVEANGTATATQDSRPADTDASSAVHSDIPRTPFLLLATSGALTAAIGAVVAVHLLTMLQSRGTELVAAVALGALIGPSQVGARVLEMLLGRYHHPIWTMLGAALLMLVGTALLYSGAIAVAVALVLYGAGMGIHSIARGTVPLALFGAGRYATVMGRLARPGAIVGALAPTLAAMLLNASGVDALLCALAAAAAANLAVATVLVASHRPRAGAHAP